MTRAIMTRAELAQHRAGTHGRDYTVSDDGYDDMAQAEGKHGWTAISGWGRDGWDLGDWPYVVIYHRNRHGKFELMQICEGDHTYYSFATAEDREAATDYLFLWYAAGHGEDWVPLTWEQREALDAGELEIDPKFRGPFSWERCGPLNPVLEGSAA